MHDNQETPLGCDSNGCVPLLIIPCSVGKFVGWIEKYFACFLETNAVFFAIDSSLFAIPHETQSTVEVDYVHLIYIYNVYINVKSFENPYFYSL